MSLLQGDRAVLVVTAGDARIDNKKYKACFKTKEKIVETF